MSLNRATVPIDHDTFLDELNRITLQRICWFLAAIILLVSILFTVSLLFPPSNFQPANGPWLVDTTISLILLGISVWLWRSSIALYWRSAFVYLFLLVQLATGNYYFFALLPVFGPTTVYVITLLSIGVILLIKPKTFCSTLLLSHTLYVILVLRSDAPVNLKTVALIDGSVGVGLSCLCQFLLFRGKMNDINRRALLKQNADEMDALMAITAHDLRSPLQSLKNLYDAQGAKPEWQKDPYRTVQMQSSALCGNMVLMIDGILTAYKVEQNPEINTASADLGGLLREAIERAQPHATRKQVTLSRSQIPRDMIATIDPTAFQHILDNIISNALKYSPPNTTVEISAWSTDHFYQINISDEGVGIPEEERPRIYEKFHRGTNQPTGDETSDGFGLFIAKTLMDSMGGELHYEPRYPTGSTFILYIPIQEDSAHFRYASSGKSALRA